MSERMNELTRECSCEGVRERTIILRRGNFLKGEDETGISLNQTFSCGPCEFKSI